MADFVTTESGHWDVLDPGEVVEDFQWRVGHLGSRGSDRRVMLSFLLPSGVRHNFALGAPTARAIAEELTTRTDADVPPEP